MSAKRMKKCPNCGLFNTNREFCKNCNTQLYARKVAQDLKEKKIKEEEIAKVIHEKENPNLAERLKEHPFWLYRIAGWMLYSAFMVVSTIGAGLAWAIAMVAAG